MPQPHYCDQRGLAAAKHHLDPATCPRIVVVEGAGRHARRASTYVRSSMPDCAARPIS